MRRVFVTGIGLVTPLAPFRGIDEFWKALCSGRDAVRPMPLPLLRTSTLLPMAGIPPEEFPDDPGIENRLLYITEYAFSMALKDAGLDIDGRHGRIGLSLGTVLGNILYKEKALIEGNDKALGKGSPDKDSLSHTALSLSEKYALNGTVFTVSTACASGSDAIGIAARCIREGEADIMIAGGTEVLNDLALSGFQALQALTNDRVRPFDRNRKGFAPGEGAAFLVLESEQSAGAGTRQVYGEILGYSSRSDANHLTGPHREGRGLADAISAALRDADISPRDIDYINAHGTGTVYNDLMETKAIWRVFGSIAQDIPVSSIKSMIGHSFGAAGAIEAVCCLLAIRGKIIPPTINLEVPDPACDLDYVPERARRHDVSVAISLAAGFGGQNSAVILGEV